MTEKTKTLALFSLPVLFAAFTLFFNLGDRTLWGDEAETALLAQNILKFGVPQVDDGKNYITLFGDGVDSNEKGLWTWSPWADEYMTAASFAIFGTNTWAARLPSALFGLLSVLFLGWLAQRVYQKKELTLLVLVLYVTNIVFILHARQCRYYGFAFFIQIGFLFGLLELLKGRSRAGIAWVALFLGLQFNSNYVLAIPNYLLLPLCGVLFYKKQPRLLRDALIAFGVASIFAAAWLLYAKPWGQSQEVGFGHFSLKVPFYLMEINFHIFPLAVFLIPLAAFVFSKIKKIEWEVISDNALARQFTLVLCAWVPLQLFTLAIRPGLFFRYVITMIPVLALLVAFILIYYVSIKWLRWSLAAVLCLTNVFSKISWPWDEQHTWQTPIVTYLQEVTTPYKNSSEDIIEFFKNNASPDQSILSQDPEFPLIFHTGMKIIDVRLYPDVQLDNLPDWILPETATGLMHIHDLALPPQIVEFYEPVILKVHNSPRGDTRPYPDERASFTAADFRDYKIYRKKNPKQENPN